MSMQTDEIMNSGTLTIANAARVANVNARRKGFWGEPRQMESERLSYEYYDHEDMLPLISEKLLLIVSEVSECTEILRVAKGHDGLAHTWTDPVKGKPEGFVYELADIIIRTLDLAQNFDLDIEKAVSEKMAFNSTRPHKHGKNF